MGGLVALGVGAILACCVAYPTYTHRYRLTVEVDVDGQVTSGSSVIETHWTAQPAGLVGGKPFSVRVFGEAVYVDLGSRGPLIVTLFGDNIRERASTSRSAHELALVAFGLRRDHAGLDALQRRRGRVELPIEALPLLITFTDVRDPRTIRAFTPAEVPSVFGPDVQLRSASVELTDAPMSRSLADALPWLRAMTPSTLIGRLEGGRHPTFYAIGLIGDSQ